jgi:hypothetical protein
VPDWDSTERSDSDEDAAWRDLVARFDSPVTAQEPVPWPEREDTSLAGADVMDAASSDAASSDADSSDAGSSDTASSDAASSGAASSGTGVSDAGGEDAAPQDPGRADAAPPASGGPPHVVIIRSANTASADWPAPTNRSGAAVPPESPFLAEEHFIPEPPPPLPKLDSMAKAAWLALFGGPGYLLLSTIFDWTLPGVAVFCAVAAFVAGVALLVFRLNDSDRGDSDDDGAVV